LRVILIIKARGWRVVMILLSIGADLLARLMSRDLDGGDSAWMLHGPTEEAVEPESKAEPPRLLAAE
jgi:hypothetical protein